MRPALTVTPGYMAAHPVYVLESEDTIIGFYSLCDLGSSEVDLDHLFVEPEAIGHGCGKRLWEHAVETARRLGFTRMRIEADPNAEGFYRAMGAERVGNIPSSVWPGRELPLLCFSLA